MPARRKRLDWSRPLPRPLLIPTVMELKTLADVRELVEKHLPADVQKKHTWRHISKCLAEAAAGGDVNNLVVSLRLVLAMERVECRPR